MMHLVVPPSENVGAKAVSGALGDALQFWLIPLVFPQVVGVLSRIADGVLNAASARSETMWLSWVTSLSAAAFSLQLLPLRS